MTDAFKDALWWTVQNAVGGQIMPLGVGKDWKITFMKKLQDKNCYFLSWKKAPPYVQINTIFEGKIVIILLPISLNICFGCSKEQSHWDGSFDYPQHMFRFRNMKIIF